MFTGFNLEISDDFVLHKTLGKTILENHQKIVEEEINKFMLGDGSINGSQMQESWFPQINADIFISHSHADREKALALAGWLKYTFDLNVFIDSCVWGYADNLLKKIDDRFCRNPGDSTYSYEKRNLSTSHVHMMLSTALSMMIDKTECIFFLNTPSSIDSTGVINSNSTKSPWIYYEIGVTKSIRKSIPKRPEGIMKKGLFENSETLTIKYDLDLVHLHKITENDLREWEKAQARNNSLHPLDCLYRKHKLILEFSC